MIYSKFAIEQLKERLLILSMKDSTPKKYAGDLLEAYEVIKQLQKENALGSDQLHTGQKQKP